MVQTNAAIGTYQVTLQVGAGASYYAGSGTTTFTIRDWSADVCVGVTADNLAPKPGDLVTYTIALVNAGPDTAMNTVVNDLLSSQVTFVSAQSTVGRLTTPAIGQSGNVIWRVGDIVSGGLQAAEIQVTVLVRGRPTITNDVSVSALTADPNVTNNSASLTLAVGGKK